MNRVRSLVFPGPWPQGVIFSLLLVIVAVLPLVVVPQAYDSFELAKETLFRAGVVVLAAGVVAIALFGHPFRIALHPINALVLVLVLWSALTTLWAESRTLAWENTVRLGMLALFYFLFQSLVSGERRRMLAVGAAGALSSLAVALWVLVQDFRAAFAPWSVPVRQTLGDWRDAVSAVGLGNSGHVADMLVLGFFLWLIGFFFARPMWQKALTIGALSLHAAALIVCWSVHSNLSLILGGAIAVYTIRHHFGLRDLARMRTRAGVLLGCWVFVVVFFVVDHPLNPHGSAQWGPAVAAQYERAGMPVPEEGFSGGIFSQAFASPRWVAGLDTRLAIWLTTLTIIKENAWLGAGAGNFVYTYPATISPIVSDHPRLSMYAGTWTNAAHNEVLQTWAELGIAGLFLLIAIVAAAFKECVERLRGARRPSSVLLLAALIAMLAAVCLQGMMSFPLRMPVGSMHFFLLIGAVCVLPPRAGEDDALMVPVERPAGPLQIGVVMKNMSHPVEASLRFESGPALAAPVAIAVACLSIYAAHLFVKPLRADILYRPVYEARFAPGGPARIIAESPRVLDIWPGHVNCRSAYQNALMQAGEWEEVVRQTPLVLRKLNAVEVYERRAVALMNLGENDAANDDWDEVFRRRPGMGRMYPGPYNAWIRRQPAE